MPTEHTKAGELEITRLSDSSWFKMKSSGTIIHFDPGYVGYFSNRGIPLAELEEKADIILISHFHGDHLKPEALEMIVKKETVILAPTSCADAIPFKTTFIKPGDSLGIGDIKITAVHAYNTPEGHSTRKFHSKGDCVGYLADFYGRRVYFAGDTDCIPEMSAFGEVSIALLPIGGTYVMDIEEAAEAVSVIKPETVIPMHQSSSSPELFRKEVNANSDTKVIILGVGEKAYV